MTTPRKQSGPKPRTVAKPAIKLCSGGHRQSQKWRLGDNCWHCIAEAERRAQADPDAIAAYRRAKAAELGPPPAVMVLRAHDGSSTQVFTTGRTPRRRR